MKTSYPHISSRIFPAVTILAAALFATPLPATAQIPTFASGNGITVQSSAQYPNGSRTVVINIATPLISKKAIRVGSHQVWITLPKDYSSAKSKRYPVLYLLHGGGDGWAGQWVSGGGKIEEITDGQDLIVVMPEGGKVGWYTDWVKQVGGEQKWESFHINQLIPWIDANLRTDASRNGRAIAGLSMGGFGALHYAFRHPDLFSYVGSFSGAADLQEPATQLTIAEQSVVNGFLPNGAFGPVISGNWKVHNPLRNVEKFRGLNIAMYAGSGAHDLDVIERTMGFSTYRFHQRLDERGIPNTFWMYGRPKGTTGCNGGHNWGCWSFALKDMLPKMM
ncbi:MAG TPA: alpha/beta hydrolase family protein, partial [Elusimicrobiales bacterium]|nr:alpha/beta hydrolase family protein [Elusimicrobiales bacterium]